MDCPNLSRGLTDKLYEIRIGIIQRRGIIHTKPGLGYDLSASDGIAITPLPLTTPC